MYAYGFQRLLLEYEEEYYFWKDEELFAKQTMSDDEMEYEDEDESKKEDVNVCKMKDGSKIGNKE